MKVNEFQLEKQGFTFSANIRKEKSHYKHTMDMGRIFPSTKAQAIYFVSKSRCLDLLNDTDVKIVETFLNKHGFTGNYKFSKSNQFVRLINANDLLKALKAEYKF
jgi:hypothetical protein